MVAAHIIVTTRCLLAPVTSASAADAGVLWPRDDPFDARGVRVSSPTEGGATDTTSTECTTAIDRLERQWEHPRMVVMRDASTMLAGIFRDKNQTITTAMSFLCAPAPLDPNGPRGV